jgi:hypothetical protein
MPLEWLVMMCAARNQIRNGKWLLCITVPAVTDVCRAQPAHSQARDFALRASPCRCHRKDTRSPQANDVPPDNANTLPHQKTWRRTPGGTWVWRFPIWLAWAEQYQNILDWQAASHYIRCRRTKGDKPWAGIFTH